MIDPKNMLQTHTSLGIRPRAQTYLEESGRGTGDDSFYRIVAADGATAPGLTEDETIFWLRKSGLHFGNGRLNYPQDVLMKQKIRKKLGSGSSLKKLAIDVQRLNAWVPDCM